MKRESTGLHRRARGVSMTDRKHEVFLAALTGAIASGEYGDSAHAVKFAKSVVESYEKIMPQQDEPLTRGIGHSDPVPPNPGVFHEVGSLSFRDKFLYLGAEWEVSDSHPNEHGIYQEGFNKEWVFCCPAKDVDEYEQILWCETLVEKL